MIHGGQREDPVEWSYMKRYSPLGSLGTRDVVARATDMQLKISGESHVLLVTEHLDIDELRRQFPTICHKLESLGIDFGLDPIPVRPAAHYLVGGVSWTSLGDAEQRSCNTWTLRYRRNCTNRPPWGESIGIKQPFEAVVMRRGVRITFKIMSPNPQVSWKSLFGGLMVYHV